MDYEVRVMSQLPHQNGGVCPECSGPPLKDDMSAMAFSRISQQIYNLFISKILQMFANKKSNRIVSFHNLIHYINTVIAKNVMKLSGIIVTLTLDI